MDENTGTAATDGEQTKDTIQDAAPDSADDAAGNAQVTVPYSQFKEVVDALKAAEESLASVVEEVIATLPENMRELVPNLPPAEKIRWINAAKQKGVFTEASAAEPNSPGSKRPGGKPQTDLNGMSPMQKLQLGFGQK